MRQGCAIATGDVIMSIFTLMELTDHGGAITAETQHSYSPLFKVVYISKPCTPHKIERGEFYFTPNTDECRQT